jgi:acyl-coenzyme A thioesterase PaaI-like protein
MKEILKYSRCFVCGDRNEHGLQAKFYLDGDRAVSRLTTRADFEGYRGIYHGGIISSMLDEVMIKAILARDIFAVTAELTVRFQKPVGIGIELTFTGAITEQKGRIFLTAGRVCDNTGAVYATATGKYLEARPELKDRLKESIERD